MSDWVGRCVAEQATSKTTLALTLTYRDPTDYGPNPPAPRAVVLFYKDVQDMLKRLRRAGYPVRYIVAGEYGAQKGRAHWHIILFFKGEAPDFPALETEKQHWKFWPWGFTFVQKPSADGFWYILKYLLKDIENGQFRNPPRMSKKPALGHEWFMEHARRTAAAGLTLRDWEYAHENVRGPDESPFRYWLQSEALRRDYVEAYKAEYVRRHKRQPVETELLVAHDDKIVRDEIGPSEDMRLLEERINGRRVPKFVRIWRSKCGLYFVSKDENGYVEGHSAESGNLWRVSIATVEEAHSVLRGVRPGDRTRLDAARLRVLPKSQLCAVSVLQRELRLQAGAPASLSNAVGAFHRIARCLPPPGSDATQMKRPGRGLPALDALSRRPKRQ